MPRTRRKKELRPAVKRRIEKWKLPSPEEMSRAVAQVPLAGNVAAPKVQSPPELLLPSQSDDKLLLDIEIPPLRPDADRVLQFMAVVACYPSEVIDTAARGPMLAAAAKRTGGVQNWEMPFGKHRGLKLGDVPEGYLQWALKVGAPRKGFCRFQRLAREELARRQSA